MPRSRQPEMVGPIAHTGIPINPVVSSTTDPWREREKDLKREGEGFEEGGRRETRDCGGDQNRVYEVNEVYEEDPSREAGDGRGSTGMR
jgi:hypothetical protein